MQPFRIRYADRIAAVFMVAVVAVVVVALVLVIRGKDIFVERVAYWTVFPDGEGLKAETSVRINGIEVGKVSRVSLTDDDKVKVEFEILGRYTDRLVADPGGIDCDGPDAKRELCGTRVRASSPFGMSSFIPGGGGLLILVGNKQNARLPAGGFVKSEVEESFLDRLKKEGIIDQARSIIAEIEAMLRRLNDNEGPLWKSMRNLEAVTAQARSGQGILGEAIAANSPLYKNVEGSLAKLNATMEHVELSAQNIKSISAGVNDKIGGFQRSVDDLEQFAKEAKEVGARLKNFAVEAEKVPPDTRAAINNLNRRIDQLGEIIQGLKHSFPFNAGPKAEEPKPAK